MSAFCLMILVYLYMKFTTHFQPKIYELYRHYNQQRFIKDICAGITVSIVALPLAMAFAIASGLRPDAGLFTAIIGGFLISLFSGSRVQIGGPAGAFIVIVYGIVEQYGVSGLLLATLMSGVILWMMGFLRLGLLIQFIPVAVIIGFTNGIAVLIGLSQIKDFLGLQINGQMPAAFFPLIDTLWQALPTWNSYSVIIGTVSLCFIISWQYLGKKYRYLSYVPGSIMALILATIGVYLCGIQVETIGSRFGGIPQNLPPITIPTFHWATIKALFIPAVTLAVLGAIESLLCARVADSMIRDKHNANQELLAQGFANMVVPFFGGMPATGTIARTMTNIKSGGTSPIAGMVHALVLLFVVLAAAPLAQYIPLAALSAILIFVAWNMGQWHEFIRLKSFRMPYRLLLVSVFILTVVVDLTVAVSVGLVLACLIFIYRISSLSVADKWALSETLQQSGITGYHLTGTIFFGAVHLIEQFLTNLPQKALVLDFSGVIYIDSSGGEAMQELLTTYQEKHIPLFIYGLRAQPYDLLNRIGWLNQLGEAYIYQDSRLLDKKLTVLSALPNQACRTEYIS